MTLQEKIFLQLKRKDYDSEKEESEEIRKSMIVKNDMKKKRREQKRIERYREETELNQKELQKDMDKRYIKYIKEKKRKQRKFHAEKAGKKFDTRMCANGWMRTNLDDKPAGNPVEGLVNLESLIDLEFDPMKNQKEQLIVNLEKNESMNVGATHLKHEIEEANVLTSSSK
jgi:hypothetical protein